MEQDTNNSPLRITVAGASGFVGTHLLRRLALQENVQIRALSRSKQESPHRNITWQKCDAFLFADVDAACQNTDVLIYLIHSMLPSSNLTQGSFHLYDINIADNFARAARRHGVKQIIFVSGIIGPDEKLSLHLQSRKEVEDTLKASGCPTTILRASLIIGEGGSSFQILQNLVQRLPVMVLPSWTKTEIQPIDINDVVRYVQHVINREQYFNGISDIAGPEVVSYEDLIRSTAKLMGLQRMFGYLPMRIQGLSKLWVSFFSGTSPNLVYPLIDSLNHRMVADTGKQLLIDDHKRVRFDDSLRAALNHGGAPALYGGFFSHSLLKWQGNVRSLQIIRLRKEMDRMVIIDAYFRWLSNWFFALLSVQSTKSDIKIKFLGFITLLAFEKSEPADDGLYICRITGGVLLNKKRAVNARMEFRRTLLRPYVLIAIHDYYPQLPWFLYRYSQAPVHAFVMARFRKFLESRSQQIGV